MDPGPERESGARGHQGDGTRSCAEGGSSSGCRCEAGRVWWHHTGRDTKGAAMGHSKAQRGLQRRHRALNADPTKEGGEKHGGELKTNRNQSQRGNKYISSQLRFSTWPKYTSGQDKANRSSDMHRWLSHALRGCIQKSETWPRPSGSWRNAGGLRTRRCVKTGRGRTGCPTTASSARPLEESGGTGSEN